MAASDRKIATILRVAATLLVVAIAALVGWFAWQHYIYAPWTRDARVQADVINIAPEVSGTVTKVAVADDSYVRKGELLFKIIQVRFKNALVEAQGALKQAKARARFTARNAQRLEALPPGGVSTQNLQQSQSQAQSAAASVTQAQARLAQARQNLDWTTVRSPVNGYVTHLRLDPGDYATQGQAVMTLVDAETFRVIAYFQETKMPHIKIGDAASIQMMAGDVKLSGHVVTIAHGIAIPNYAAGERNLPNVNPTFQWVRLAQRIPVTIAFDKDPRKLPLSIGLTATVHIHPDQQDPSYRPSPHKSPLRLSPMESLQDNATAGPFAD